MSQCGTTCFHSYKYDTVIQFQNDSVNIAACGDPLETEHVPEIQMEPSVEDKAGKYHLKNFEIEKWLMNFEKWFALIYKWVISNN